MCKSVVQRTAIKKHIIYINIDVCMSCMYVCTEGTCSKKVVDCFILYNKLYIIYLICVRTTCLYIYIYMSCMYVHTCLQYLRSILHTCIHAKLS